MCINSETLNDYTGFESQAEFLHFTKSRALNMATRPPPSVDAGGGGCGGGGGGSSRRKIVKLCPFLRDALNRNWAYHVTVIAIL